MKLNQYQILEVIGGGKSPGVFLAEDDSHSHFIIKKNHPLHGVSDMEAIHREILVLRRLQHPHIGRFVEVCSSHDSLSLHSLSLIRPLKRLMIQDNSFWSWNILKDRFLLSPLRLLCLQLTLQVSLDPELMGVVIILKRKRANYSGLLSIWRQLTSTP
jgi:serine/threonine protein kinase